MAGTQMQDPALGEEECFQAEDDHLSS
jgi:hypothetical protein